MEERVGKKIPDRYNKSDKSNQRYTRKKFVLRKRECFFCKNIDTKIDYKDILLMKRYIGETYKITPRRFTGACARHQRKLSVEIKKARIMALIPFTDK